MPYQFDSDLSPPVRAHLLEGPQDINRAAFYNALERSYSGDPRQEEIAHNRVGMGGDQAPLCEAGRDLGAPISQEPVIAAIDEPTLAEKVTCLSWPDVYGKGTGAVSRRETHMSWVFFADDRVFKLKKPVRFAYLDFSTLVRREAACRAELELNRRLAGDVYLDVVPLVWTQRGLALGGCGITVDWLVVMRRLNEALTLEHMLLDHRLTSRDLDLLITTLAAFYQHATPIRMTPGLHLAEWHRNLCDNRQVLLDPRLEAAAGLVRMIDKAQRRFLHANPDLFAARVRGHKIVDGHGDLRPEHVFVDDRIRIIDCLEFNPKLRAVDPLDEVAFLSVECDRLGAPWASDFLQRRILRTWGALSSEALFCFYRCYRATLRARLTLAHLLEPNPRTPEKWPLLARAYLHIAAADAIRLERKLKTR
jgi:aminoglycoside phosphotransferase family enzyme